MANSTAGEILGEIPNIIVLALLLFALLFVATKYNWIHCTQIPQWCNVYCQVAGHSQVAIISGNATDSGMGNPQLLASQIQAGNINTVVVPFTSDQISQGVLNGYSLVILDHYRDITLAQAQTLEAYVNSGGNLVWLGDAASHYVSDPSDEALALAENRTQPGFYEAYHAALAKINSSSFGPMGNMLGAAYVSQVNTPTNVSLIQLIPTNTIVQGIKNGYYFNLPYVTVAENPSVSTKVAVLGLPGGQQVPAVLERRYVGTIVYISFPVELANSPTLTQNLVSTLIQC